ncbi:MAG: alkanesulfonate monooxygenase [Saprospiraceae bacterium]|jgi:alkanesulfonate monooxygenase
MLSKSLRFHWSMSSVGETLKASKKRVDYSGVPDIKAHIQFCKKAEACGIEHVLTAFGFHRVDPIALASSLGVLTEKINFLVASRSGVVSPTMFVQQINSISAITNGRICINMVAGHSPKEFMYYGDFLAPEKRYERTDEFLTICRMFWEENKPVNFSGTYYQVKDAVLNTPFVSDTRSSPEIYLGGKSKQAFELAAKHASCLLTLPERPEDLELKILTLLQQNTEVGLLVSILARPTREQAINDAYAHISPLGERAKKNHQDFKQGSISEAFNSALTLGNREEDWLSSWLWTGAVPYLGAPSIAIVGSYEEVADAIMEYKSIGISQFLFMGWPDIQEMELFGKEVLPRVRKKEMQRESIETQ